MPGPCVLAATARTLSFLIAPDGARYALPAPISWVLRTAGGTPVAEGVTHTVSLFVDDLSPRTEYRLETELGQCEVRTLPCAGLVDATDHGVTTTAKDNAAAFASAIAAVPPGGTLRLPPGRYLSGPIFLKPGMTLHFDESAELAAIADRESWPKLPSHDAQARVLGTWEGLPECCFAALVTAIDADRLAITGRGVIDGGGSRGDWWSWPKETRDGARRPRTLHLAYSDCVTLSGLTIRNSPSWTVHPYRCRDLHASALTIENPPDSPNTDGFNPESCENVTMTGIRFSVGDDCTAIKAGKRRAGDNSHLAPTRGVKISHCLMERGHGAVVLGSEMSGGIHDVDIARCTFHATDRGLRLKTRRGRGGVIENVSLTEVDMHDVPTPLAVNAFYFCDADGKDDWVQSRRAAPVDATTPVIRNITLSRVSARGVTTAAAALLGLPEAPAEGIRLDGFHVDYAPDATPEVPLMALGVAPVRFGGVIAEFAAVEGCITLARETKDKTHADGIL